jgi:mono/diheme cytochrome c family protein
MKRDLKVLGVLGGAALLAAAATGKADDDEEQLVAHGRYLVHEVAMCIYCHTPKDDRTGALVEEKLLQGAPLPVKSPYPEQEWAFRAPTIAGLPGGWTAEQLVHFLRTGKNPRGETARPPMPPFRMEERDAKAVAAYLAQLP